MQLIARLFFRVICCPFFSLACLNKPVYFCRPDSMPVFLESTNNTTIYHLIAWIVVHTEGPQLLGSKLP